MDFLLLSKSMYEKIGADHFQVDMLNIIFHSNSIDYVKIQHLKETEEVSAYYILF